MPVPSLTIEELIQSLKRSNLPTVLCEGDTDLAILRFVEGVLGPTTVSLLPCYGRDMVLRVYDRRDEIPNTRIAYLADRDVWVLSGVPNRYKGVIFTWGYSIENDLLDATNLENLLTPTERR